MGLMGPKGDPGAPGTAAFGGIARGQAAILTLGDAPVPFPFDQALPARGILPRVPAEPADAPHSAGLCIRKDGIYEVSYILSVRRGLGVHRLKAVLFEGEAEVPFTGITQSLPPPEAMDAAPVIFCGKTLAHLRAGKTLTLRLASEHGEIGAVETAPDYAAALLLYLLAEEPAPQAAENFKD
jgi:hypothetical protein